MDCFALPRRRRQPRIEDALLDSSTDTRKPEGRLEVEGRPGGPLGTVSYVVADAGTGAWALVDPAHDVLETWRDRLETLGPPAAILVTHGHFDHIGGLAGAHRRFPDAPIYVHPHSAPMLTDEMRNLAAWAMMPCEPCAHTHLYREGDVFQLGKCALKIIEAPGHCPGSIMLLCGNDLIAGDVLFQGSVGRWDLPGASYEELADSIRRKVMTLPDSTRVYPGHGDATTVGIERRTNPIVAEMMEAIGK